MVRGKPVREGLFVLDDSDGIALIAAYCHTCTQRAFPFSECCPYCGSTETEKVLLSRHGVLELCTLVRRPSPGYQGPVPYGFGVVCLPEGIAVIAPIVTREVLPAGTRVECTVVDVGTDEDGQTLLGYAFVPANPVDRRETGTEQSSGCHA